MVRVGRSGTQLVVLQLAFLNKLLIPDVLMQLGQNHVLQGPSILTNTTICHMFWKTAEFLSETTQTLR